MLRIIGHPTETREYTSIPFTDGLGKVTAYVLKGRDYTSYNPLRGTLAERKARAEAIAAETGGMALRDVRGRWICIVKFTPNFPKSKVA